MNEREENDVREDCERFEGNFGERNVDVERMGQKERGNDYRKEMRREMHEDGD